MYHTEGVPQHAQLQFLGFKESFIVYYRDV